MYVYCGTTHISRIRSTIFVASAPTKNTDSTVGPYLS